MNSLELKIPPVVLALLVALLMWAVDRALPSMKLQLAVAGQAAWVMLAAGVVIGLAGVVSFRRACTTVNPTRPGAASTLVRSGIYRVTRNPMYLGLLLALLGWATYLRHPWSSLFVPIFVLYMNRFQILPEERALNGLFGQEFQDYARQVRRWF